VLEDAPNRQLLTAWRDGNDFAATVLVRRYMARLTSLASSRLSRKLARRVDAEDVVLSAWRSFFVAAGRDRVEVAGDDNLWPLLVTVTLRKLSRQAARHTAECRSIHAEERPREELSWPAIVAQDPTPADAAMVTDQIENLMAGLTPLDGEILTKRLQGEQHCRIAEEVGCSERTVRRSLQLIRERYLATGQGDDAAASGCDCIAFTNEAKSKAETHEGDGANGFASPGQAEAERSQRENSTAHFDDFSLQQLVGQGTFGKVYRAIRSCDDTTVAVKYLRKTFWKNDVAADQLIREVSIVSKLSHRGIIQHFGWGKARSGGVFTIMEWVDGEDLDAWRRASKRTLAEIIDCGIAVCGALAVAHHAGVIHADVTPRNILRRKDGTFVLTDFGFSRLRSAPVNWHSGGTPGFLAPEQISDAFGRVSRQTDVFGLGSVLYFLMTGQPPFAGRDAPETLALTLSSHAAARVSSLVPGCVPAFDVLIARCLKKEPHGRPNSVTTVLKQLKCIEYDQPALPQLINTETESS
jgi:tRNA A-37 threonylcarbamoyl transferase component Bud32/DNA-directed RNA polymerase specialized sigma24 family protein